MGSPVALPTRSAHENIAYHHDFTKAGMNAGRWSARTERWVRTQAQSLTRESILPRGVDMPVSHARFRAAEVAAGAAYDDVLAMDAALTDQQSRANPPRVDYWLNRGSDGVARDSVRIASRATSLKRIPLSRAQALGLVGDDGTGNTEDKVN
jgi:hypothetical protein